ncbi:MAG: endo-1,4-beta-xylanase [Lachnospiraceae bacterium]|nr:endo-1,4-beta-xylanase [Lachnospiraceae bacterium]
MKKLFNRGLALLIAFTVGLSVLSPFSKVFAATEYVDTSGYESLAEVYSDYFKVGAACEAISHWGDQKKEIGNPNKEAVIAGLFNSITCGNELKPAYNFDKTKEGLFKVDRAGEQMLKWAKDNGTNMRFHVLVWHSQVNPSFFAKDFKATSNGVATTSDSAVLDEECLVDRDTLVDRLRTYIYSAIEYLYQNGFAETVYAIDVVNEAVDESKDDGLRRSYWYKIIGPEFLYYAFLFTREAEVKYSKQYADLYGLDPNGDLSSITPKLFYNDYNEWFPARVNIVKDFVTNRDWNKDQKMIKSDVIKKDGNGTLKGDGLIDGIGMQGHLSDNNSVPQYINALEQYASIVDEVHVTELDVKCTHHGENQWYYQAKFYYDFFSALIEAKKNGANLTSVTVWGLTDDSSWITDGYPLLFSYNLTAKPAYYGVLLAGKGEEFNLSIAETITELKDINVDFEPYKDEFGANVLFSAESAGFYKRGTGHMSSLRIVSKINHTENADIGFAILCERSEQDATCMLDISKFSGKNITITVYVKTDDTEVAMGLDTGTSTELKRVKSEGDWVPISINTDIPEKLDSAYLYFETNGSSKLYIDDISVIYTRDGEAPAPVLGEDSQEEITPSAEPTATPAPTIEVTEITPAQETQENIPSSTESAAATASETSSTGMIIAIILIALGIIFLGFGITIFVRKSKSRKKSKK